MNIQGPIVQVAIDVTTLDQALRIAEASVKAGADWLEAGTPLIVFEGVKAIGVLARTFPEMPILADYKMVDGAARYVYEAARQGGQLVTVCGVASDASIRAAVKVGREQGIKVVADLYAVKDLPTRAQELAMLGVDSVYVHLGSDQRAEDPNQDPLAGLQEVCAAVDIPVGVGTFRVEEGIEAFCTGATIATIGFPLITSDNPEVALREYVNKGKETYYLSRAN